MVIKGGRSWSTWWLWIIGSTDKTSWFIAGGHVGQTDSLSGRKTARPTLRCRQIIEDYSVEHRKVKKFKLRKNTWFDGFHTPQWWVDVTQSTLTLTVPVTFVRNSAPCRILCWFYCPCLLHTRLSERGFPPWISSPRISSRFCLWFKVFSRILIVFYLNEVKLGWQPLTLCCGAVQINLTRLDRCASVTRPWVMRARRYLNTNLNLT